MMAPEHWHMQLLHLFFLFFRSLATLPIVIVILHVLLTPNNYCFQNQVTPPSDGLWVVHQTFTKLDMVYCDFV